MFGNNGGMPQLPPGLMADPEFMALMSDPQTQEFLPILMQAQSNPSIMQQYQNHPIMQKMVAIMQRHGLGSYSFVPS